jgi:hypothetical protein
MWFASIDMLDARGQVVRQRGMAQTCERQLIKRIRFDQRLSRLHLYVTVIVTGGRLRLAEMRGRVLEMDADGGFLPIETQVQMRVGNAQGKQRDCRYPQCDCPFVTPKHGRSMPQSLFQAIGTVSFR